MPGGDAVVLFFITSAPVSVARVLLLLFSHRHANSVCLTVCDPVDHRPPGSSVHEIILAGILEWVAISFSRGSS